MASEASKSIGYIGSTVSAVISYAKWHSIGWAIVHCFFGWFYVLYYAIKF